MSGDSNVFRREIIAWLVETVFQNRARRVILFGAQENYHRRSNLANFSLQLFIVNDGEKVGFS